MINLKKLSLGIAVTVGLLISASSCQRVAPNYQGVLMQDFGQNGKSDFSLVLGRVSTISPGTELFQVPLFEQRGGFDKNISLKAADNTEFSSNPKYSYSVIKERSIDVVFQNKQLGSGDEFMRSLEDNILEPKINDIMKEASRAFVSDSLMANGGSLRYERYVESKIKEEFNKRGLELTTFSSQLEFSDKVTNKIDNRNEINTNISVLDQQLAEQLKINELAKLRAEESIIRSKGLTPEVLNEMAIKKWNGVGPSVVGTGTSGFYIPTPTVK